MVNKLTPSSDRLRSSVACLIACSWLTCLGPKALWAFTTCQLLLVAAELAANSIRPPSPSPIYRRSPIYSKHKTCLGKLLSTVDELKALYSEDILITLRPCNGCRVTEKMVIAAAIWLDGSDRDPTPIQRKRRWAITSCHVCKLCFHLTLGNTCMHFNERGILRDSAFATLCCNSCGTHARPSTVTRQMHMASELLCMNSFCRNTGAILSTAISSIISVERTIILYCNESSAPR